MDLAETSSSDEEEGLPIRVTRKWVGQVKKEPSVAPTVIIDETTRVGAFDVTPNVTSIEKIEDSLEDLDLRS